MPRAKKQVEETEVKKTTVKKSSPKKTTAKKTVSTKSVTQKAKKEPKVTKPVPKFSSLDDISVETFFEVTKDQQQAEKFVQLINDYNFEKDQTERIRCVAIAFGNWRHGFEFDPAVGSKENFESHNFEKAKKILSELVN